MNFAGTASWLAAAGWIGGAALALGVLILVLAFAGARARFSLVSAFLMLGTSALLLGLTFFVFSFGGFGWFGSIAEKGPDVQPGDAFLGMWEVILYTALTGLGSLLAFIGSIRAFFALRPRDPVSDPRDVYRRYES